MLPEKGHSITHSLCCVSFEVLKQQILLYFKAELHTIRILPATAVMQSNKTDFEIAN